jgi:hypothetical protein
MEEATRSIAHFARALRDTERQFGMFDRAVRESLRNDNGRLQRMIEEDVNRTVADRTAQQIQLAAREESQRAAAAGRESRTTFPRQLDTYDPNEAGMLEMTGRSQPHDWRLYFESDGMLRIDSDVSFDRLRDTPESYAGQGMDRVRISRAELLTRSAESLASLLHEPTEYMGRRVLERRVDEESGDIILDLEPRPSHSTASNTQASNLTIRNILEAMERVTANAPDADMVWCRLSAADYMTLRTRSCWSDSAWSAHIPTVRANPEGTFDVCFRREMPSAIRGSLTGRDVLEHPELGDADPVQYISPTVDLGSDDHGQYVGGGQPVTMINNETGLSTLWLRNEDGTYRPMSGVSGVSVQWDRLPPQSAPPVLEEPPVISPRRLSFEEDG